MSRNQQRPRKFEEPTTATWEIGTIHLTSEQRKKAYRKLGKAVSSFVSDPQVGICRPHPWGVRKSAGYDCMQIITEPRESKLERRSLETVSE